MNSAALAPSPLPSLAKERSDRVLQSVITSLLTKPLALLIPLLTVPWFLSYLGVERFGLLETVAALATWLGLTQLGFGLGLMNRLTDCFVSGDRHLARRYVSTLFIATGTVLAAASVVLAAVIPLVDWQGIFPMQAPLTHGEMVTVLGLAAGCTLLGVFTANLPPIYSGYQELARLNWWDGASKVVCLAGCFVVVQTGLGITGVVLALVGLPVVVRLVNLAWLFTVEKPWLRPSFRLFSWPLLKPMLGEGFCFFLLQMAGVIILSTDKLIISATLGPAAVADYAVLGRVFLIASGGYMLLLTPLWPAYGEACRRRDVRWIRKNLSFSLWLVCGSILVLGAVLFWQGDTLMQWWLGRPFAGSRTIIAGMTAGFLLRAWVDCRSVVLNSAGYAREQLSYWVAQAFLHLVLSLILMRMAGVAGVAWAAPLSALLTTTWGYPLLMRTLFKRMEAGAPASNPILSRAVATSTP